MYIDSFMARVDITAKLEAELRCDALLVVGSKSSQCAAAEYMHSHMDKVIQFEALIFALETILKHSKILCIKRSHSSQEVGSTSPMVEGRVPI